MKNICRFGVILLFVLSGTLSWTSRLVSDQAGAGLQLPEVVVVGRDSVKLEGFRDFAIMPMVAPGTKPQPVSDQLDLARERSAAAPEWSRPEVQSPGCAYRHAVTAYLARGLTGAAGYYRSGKQQYIDGAYQEAAYYFQELLSRFPESEFVSSARYWLGEIAYREHRWPAAADYFRQAAADPRCQYRGYAFYSLGWLAHQQGKYRQAAKNFAAVQGLEKAAKLRPSALFWQGESLLRAGSRDDSRRLLQQLLRQYPKSGLVPQARYLLASMAINDHDYQAGLAQLEEILRLKTPFDVQDVLARQSLLASGWCQFFLHRYDRAAAVFQRLLGKQAPADTLPLAFLGYGLSLVRQDQVEAALALVQERPAALRRHRVAAMVLREIIAWQVAHQQLPAAIATSRLLVDTLPAALLEENDFLQLAGLYWRQESFDLALETVEQGLSQLAAAGKERGFLQLEKARLLLRLGKVESAIALLRQQLAAAGTAGRGPEWQRRAALLLGRAYNAAGNYSSALNVLRELKGDARFPEIVLAAYERGWARLKLGAYEEALAELDFFLAHQEAVTDTEGRRLLQNAWLNRGECLFNLHRDEAAFQYYQQFLERFPASPFRDRARYYMAWINLRRGKIDQAKAGFEAILQDFPATRLQDAIHYQLGQCYFNAGKYREAIDAYRLVIERYPDSAFVEPAWLKIAESYFNLGDFLRAKLTYLRLARDYPGGLTEEKARYGLLLLANKQHQYDYLEAETGKFFRRFPTSPYLSPLVLMVADVYRQQRQWDKLRSLLEQVIAGNYPDAVKMDAMYQMVALAEANGDQQGVRAWCRRLLAAYPDGKYACDCNLLLGKLAYQQGEYRQAYEFLADNQQRCNDLHLKRQSLLYLAKVNEKTGHPDAAQRSYKELVAKNYRDSITYAAYEALAALYEQRRNYAQAEFYYQQAAQNPKAGRAAAAQYRRAVVLQKAGNLKAAIKQYLSLPYLFPKQNAWIIKALQAAARLYEQDRNPAAAAKIYRKLLQYPLSEKQRQEIKKRLAVAGKAG